MFTHHRESRRFLRHFLEAHLSGAVKPRDSFNKKRLSECLQVRHFVLCTITAPFHLRRRTYSDRCTIVYLLRNSLCHGKKPGPEWAPELVPSWNLCSKRNARKELCMLLYAAVNNAPFCPIVRSIDSLQSGFGWVGRTRRSSLAWWARCASGSSRHR